MKSRFISELQDGFDGHLSTEGFPASTNFFPASFCFHRSSRRRVKAVKVLSPTGFRIFHRPRPFRPNRSKPRLP